MSVKYRHGAGWARIAADTRHVCEGVRLAWTGDAPVISLYDDDCHIPSHGTIDLTELADLHDKVGQLLDHIRQTDTQEES